MSGGLNEKNLYFGALYLFLMKHLPKSAGLLGMTGKLGRRWCCKHLFASCGKGVNVERGAEFGSGKLITIGDRSGIGVNAILSGEVSIGNDVMMGPRVACFARNHDFSRLDIPMNQQGYQAMKPIIIGDDV